MKIMIVVAPYIRRSNDGLAVLLSLFLSLAGLPAFWALLGFCRRICDIHP